MIDNKDCLQINWNLIEGTGELLMLKSISKARITQFSRFLGEYRGKFAIYGSLSESVAQQFYIVPKDFESKDRIEPLAHVVKRTDGKLFFSSYQPEIFSIGLPEHNLREDIGRTLSKIHC